MTLILVYNIVESLTSISASVFDITTDIRNSMDFLRYNVRNGSNQENGVIERSDPVWTGIGIGIVFLPGLLSVPLFFTTAITNRSWKGAIAALILSLFYPMTLIAVQLLMLLIACTGRASNGKNKGIQGAAMTMVGLEAFWESFPQMVLQVCTLLYGYPITSIQRATIMTSFLLLAKTSISYDMMMTTSDLTLIETVKHILKTMPCYFTTIVSRVLSISLTISYLRIWSIVPITILYLELVLLSYRRYSKQKDRTKWDIFFSVYYSSLCNFGGINAKNFSDAIRAEEKGVTDEELEASIRFIKLSSVITFLHHTTVLVTIVLVSWYYEGYLAQDQFEDLIIKKEEFFWFENLNWVFGGTILLGFYGMVLSLYRVSSIVRVKL